MSSAKFVHYDLKLAEPAFDSSLTDLIIELDYLRKKTPGGSTHPKVFFQLKHIFYTLESIGSAQIEGNNTTIAEYIETKLEANKNVLSAANAHHRFVWIHPFGNGNGRTVRLFTNAMLVKTGFNVNSGRIIHPAAVFCNNRNDYYNYLSEADKGTDAGILKWSEYVLKGLKDEIEKTDKLSEYNYLRKEILFPAITHSIERRHIANEGRILKKAVEKQVVQAADLKEFFEGKVQA